MKGETSTTVTLASSEKSAQTELEAARVEVMAVEKEVVKIKVALRAIDTPKPTSSPGGESAKEEHGNDGDSDGNLLKVYATKITGLPDNCKPMIHLQLSSPIESQTLTSLFDPIDTDKEGSFAIFRGVETEVATLELTLNDANLKVYDNGTGDNSCSGTVGTSAAHPVIPMCEIDFLGGGIRKKVTDLSVAIVTDSNTSPSDSASLGESKEEKKEDTSTKAENEEKITTPEAEEEKEGAENEEKIATPEAEEEKEEADKGNDEIDAKVEATEADDKTNEEVNGTDETEAKSDVVAESDEDLFEDATSKTGSESVDAKSEFSDGVVVPAASVISEEPVPDTITGKDDDIEKEEEEEEEEKEESNSQPSTTTPPATTTSVLLPTCSIDIRVEFNPSPRDEKDALYDLLNKASKKKAKAIDRLRKAAAAMNQAKATAATSSTMVTKSDAVKSGFLNRSTKSSLAKKEPMVLVRWYRKVLGPQSLLRVVFPLAKNYLLFFGGVFVMHYQGYQLALPPPV